MSPGMTSFVRRLLSLVALVFALVLAFVFVTSGLACGDDEEATVLQGLDLSAPEGSESVFDRNDILSTAALTDIDSIDAFALQTFLTKTPYERPSFLETYQSNGVRAADAIARAARQYRINPLVFLVYAQTTQGLVGERNYPSPPERVEYVFRCGCIKAGNCLPEFAGFDRQVDCLGRALRASLDEIAEKGETNSGWGPDKPTSTIEGLKVTPANEATAALYDRTPRIDFEAGGGTWIFWNVYTRYALNLNYSGPSGGPAGGKWIGDDCTANASCGYDNGTCADNYEGGYCTAPCDGDCPSEPDRPEAFCAAFSAGGFCFRVCNPGAPACRPGYKCVLLARFKGDGPNDAKHVCHPPT